MNFSIRFCFLYILYAIIRLSYALNTDKTPVKISGSFSAGKVASAVSLGALGLIGKVVYDGPKFTDAVSLKGKNVVITGGNTGLGKETAKKLASLGADTTILCKSLSRGNTAVDEIVKVSGNSNVRCLSMDLASLESVEKCSLLLQKQLDKIDILVNNAGVMAIPTRELTSDGFEKHLGINHIGHFALTALNWNLLKKAKASRVINVASTAHMLGHLNFNDLMLEKDYQPWPAYGNSKLANILFTKELAKRFPSSGVLPLVCHPGVCRTELGRYLFDPNDIPPALAPVLGVIGTIVGAPAIYLTKSSEQGAQTQIFLSASSKLSQADAGEVLNFPY